MNSNIEIKYGAIGINPDRDTPVTFNTAFKNECLSISVTSTGNSVSSLYAFKVASFDKNGFVAHGTSVKGTSNPIYASYIAIGY